ncbi:MAG: hypothetical protein ED555_12865 [Allomuricauda sp.]|nr:MAG: hypothetical protein ED555_12865 [Allomuricauda sp.]
MDWITIFGLLSAGISLWFVVFKTEWNNMIENYKLYFFIAVLIMLIGIGLKFSIDPGAFQFGFLLSLIPFFFLSLYYPLTNGFKKIFKRDPKIGIYSGVNFSDLIYTMLLFLGSGILPALIDTWIVKTYF